MHQLIQKSGKAEPDRATVTRRVAALYSQTIVATNYLYLSTIKEDFLLSLSQFSFACVFALNWINAYSCKCALKLPLIALPDVTDTLVVASKKKLWNFIAIFKYF